MNVNNQFEIEAQRFNLIANNIDRFGEIIETISNENIKNTAKSILNQLENLVLESPEWTLNSGVYGINIGIFGTVKSGWKELISFLTDSQEQDYFDDMGIRLKHVIKLSDESKYLILLRRDGEIIPDVQFSNWVDIGIFVFGLENERTFKEALLSHKELISLRSINGKWCPTILVGCRDGITRSSPRLKSYVEMQELTRNYGFDEYLEVRNADGFNTFFVFEYCTLLASKALSAKQATLGQPAGQTPSSGDATNPKKRKNNKRKNSVEDEFKTPKGTGVGTRKIAKNAKRTSSICDSSSRDTTERRLSISTFRFKNRSLPRSMPDPGRCGSLSSSSSVCDLANHHQAQGQLNQPIPPHSIIRQGVLYKGRNKKWVTVTDDAKMFYHKSRNDYSLGLTPKYIDLQFSNAKVPGNNSQNGHFSRSTKRRPRNSRKINDQDDKRLIIINTRNGKSQCVTREYWAATEQERDDWMNVITDAIFQHYARTKLDRNGDGPVPAVTNGGSSSTDTSTVTISACGSDSMSRKKTVADSVTTKLAEIRRQFGNDTCAECGALHPDWLVFNIGVLVCDRCAGGHRQLGVEISKVCSLMLDCLDDVKIGIALEFGNCLVNSVLEARLPLTDDCKPSSDSASIDEWLHNKYVLRKYVAPVPLPREEIQKQLIFAIQDRDRRYQLVCLMNSARAQLDLPYDAVKDSRTALMIAVRIGDIIAVQLLLWAGVDPAVKDSEGLNAYSFTYGHLDSNGGGVSRVSQCCQPGSENRVMFQIQELLKRFKTPVQLLVTTGAATVPAVP